MATLMTQRILRGLALGVIVFVCGCSSVMHKATRQFANNLSNAILSEDDPGTVRDGVPAYLLLIDGLIQGDAQNDGLLLAGSNLYGAYAGGFVAEPERAQRLAKRSFDYAKKATCLRNQKICAAMSQPFEAFAAAVADTKEKDLDVLFGLASATGMPSPIFRRCRRCSIA